MIVVGCWVGSVAVPARAQLTTLRLADYATAPITGNPNLTNGNLAQLARINFLREEPGGSGDRFFLNDLNGPLYILDKQTRQFTTYLNFNGNVNNGLFDEMTYTAGFANGLVTFQFDPDYQNNGRFYTVHLETSSNNVSGRIPNNANFPGLDTTGYTTSAPLEAPGQDGDPRHAVLIEWTDTDIANTTFEGTARELLRVEHNGRIHPMGDLIFNPLATTPDHPDWRVMYVAVGDGGSGEQFGSARLNPQRLDSLLGKVLRIIPDLDEHTETSSVSENGRYRVPDDNPFVDIPGARAELYTVGHRNNHRLTWDVNPLDPEDNQLITNEIGLHTWEEVNFLHAGANYGYSQREGNEVLITNTSTAPLPNPDVIPWQVNGTTTAGFVIPNYPVIQYGHEDSDDPIRGDAIADGIVYRGSAIPELYGKYLFGDISTGQLFYADYAEMQAADDGDPHTMAEIHPLSILWDDPHDDPDEGEILFTDLLIDGTPYNRNYDLAIGSTHQIIETAYHQRGGIVEHLPGAADVTGGAENGFGFQRGFGRADIRILADAAGELYLFSKSDGMIRQFIPFEVVIANPGDYNDDGVVNAADYVLWRNSMGTEKSLANDAIGGEVGMAHYTQWLENFGNAIAQEGALSSVPEPTSLSLAAVALAAMLPRRRGRPSPALPG